MLYLPLPAETPVIQIKKQPSKIVDQSGSEPERQTAHHALWGMDNEQLVVDRLSPAASWKKLRTAMSISHLAELKSMNGSACRTWTSKRASIPDWLPDYRAGANPSLKRQSTVTCVDVSGTSVSSDVETS